MKDIALLLKRIALFLFGIFLVIWGYKANANNNKKNEKEEGAASKNKDAAPKDTTAMQPQKEKPGVIIYRPNEKEGERKQDEKPDKKNTVNTKTQVVPKEEASAPATQVVQEEPKVVIENAQPEEASGTE